jgi:hypothetical protein
VRNHKTAFQGSWRDRLPIHPAAREFADPTPAGLRKLADNIATNGLQNKPKVQWRDGRFVLLDGRSRLDALELLGRIIDPIDTATIFEVVSETVEATAYIIGANILRRHLSTKDKRRLIGKLLRATPEQSNNAIAKTIQVDDKTVAAERQRLESTSEIPKLNTTIGRDGRTRRQPAIKTRTPATKVATTPIASSIASAIASAATSPVLPAPPMTPVIPPPVALPLANNNLEPEASATARKATYAAMELQPDQVTNDYPANRVTSGEHHSGLTSALRKAMLAAESDGSADEIIGAFKAFITLAAALGVPLDGIDVCARRVLQ